MKYVIRISCLLNEYSNIAAKYLWINRPGKNVRNDNKYCILLVLLYAVIILITEII